MKSSSITATRLRTILIASIVLLIILGVVGFYFAQNILTTVSNDVGQSVANSAASGDDVASLTKLQAQLASQKDIIAKTSKVLASSQNYQTQAITDLNVYAAATGLAISDYKFAQGASATGGAQTTVTVSLNSPISYSKLLTFMYAIENNIPKMQISGLNLSRVEGSNDSIKTDALTIEVYSK